MKMERFENVIMREKGDRWHKRQTERTFGEQYKVLCMVLNSHMTHAAGTGTVHGHVLGSKSCSCSDKKDARLEVAALVDVEKAGAT